MKQHARSVSPSPCALHRAALLLAAFLLLAGAWALPAERAKGRAKTPAAASRGLDLAGMDTAVRPGDDFFAYANGTWVKNTPIPADYSSYGAGAVAYELTEKRTAEIIRQAAEAKGRLAR